MRVGIIGAGQLGQMLGFAARNLDIECRFLDPSPAPPAAACGEVIQKPFDDVTALEQLAADCDVITYEFENVPVDALRKLPGSVPVHPPIDALRQAQDRLLEKQLFASLDIPLPGYHAIDSFDDCVAAADKLGLPMVIKTRRLGYDGKGQFVVRATDELASAWQTLGGQPLIAEQWVEFDMEVSAIGVRDAKGSIRTYDLTKNVHRDGILRTSRAPLTDDRLQQKASVYIGNLLQHLDYVGVLALELFVCGDDLLANEFAPRVHNSGHWTIEGAATSQFENHMRAVAGLALGDTRSLGNAGMVNLIGEIPEGVRSLSSGHLHDYGKTPRAGRKLGHISVVDESPAGRDELLRAIDEIVN